MAEPPQPQKLKPIPNKYKFLFGGAAGMLGTCFVQPMDLLKNRMQMSGEGGKAREHKTSIQLLASVIRKEGFLALYNGLSAGLLRQATYTTTRLGIYTWLFELLTREDKPPNFTVKTCIGMFAGVCGAFVGTPAEVALIRMTSDGRLPPQKRRNYKNVVDALIRICREEGLTTCWKGTVATMARAMVINAAQLATYSQSKQVLSSTGHFSEGLFLHFCSSMISGLVTCTVSLPIDIAKTRIQNVQTESRKKQTGLGEMLGAIVKNEGPLTLWKGFMPYYLRIGPHTIITFVFLEQFNSAYRRFSRNH
ncbi:mitochondrial 2-oxoglutarate/malate carrier protein-like [Euwallacea similis]|uniref:mitochondrial 2-oxoglutarate/malate carrier protein-like n=1 Tax=Euwallacea similis TaxID=1736056 RepID=UPI00344EA4A9